MTWLKHKKIGRADVYSLTDGKFRLDGGSMFGIVPKTLWEKIIPPDERNRIQLQINPMLIQLEGKNILIETGMDDKSGAKFESIYAVEREETIFDGLQSLGLEPGDINLVICTHLHFDHVGRNAKFNDAGELEPTFANARYVVQRQELEDATHTHERNRASYLDHNILPILEHDQIDLVEGETELMPGLRVVLVPGHNLGQQAVILESEGEGLVFTADLLPTFFHLPYAFIMGFDLYPMTTLETRKKYFPEWSERGFWIAPPHDPTRAWAKIRPAERGGFELEPE
jgi:glyoxylase-like metal-dependent hydrolase (beta-lactamase superfamily II)